MELQYLLFDFSDEDSGAGSFDAMAAVRGDRVAAVRAEVDAVLRWARDTFGAPGDAEHEGDWRYDLQESEDPRDGRTLVTFTLSGSPAFCAGFEEAFPREAG